MKAEIISCGTELLLGEIIDTNTPYLARELAKIGVNVYYHATVGDNPKRLLDTIKHAETRSDLIFISGGLGPTQDDITKDILADYLNLNLVLDLPSLEKIKKRYDSEEISAPNQHQAMVVEGAIVLKNDIGMAAGMFLTRKNKCYVLLPGPPNEFEHMVTEQLIPLLLEQSERKGKLESRNLNFYGLPEAVIAEKLTDLIEKQSNPTIAIYAKEGIIDIRMTVSGEDEQKNQELLDQTERKIKKCIGEYFVSYNKQTMEDVIREELKAQNFSLAVAEVNIISQFLTNSNDSGASNPLKSTFYFSTIKEAQQCFHLTKNNSSEPELMHQNEQLAWGLREKLGVDYSLAITAFGKVADYAGAMPEYLYMTIIDAQGVKTNKKLHFNQRMYLADWVIRLKVSDFVRRQLLNLPQLDN